MKSFFGILFLLLSYPFFCFSQMYNTGNGEGFDMKCIDWQPPAVLPFTLLNAEAYCNANTVSIKWTVASVNAGDMFIIEHSVDGFNFDETDQTTVTQSKYSAQNYTIIDKNPVFGKSVYRIKYINRERAVFYSHTFFVNCKPTDAVTINIYPNPSYGSLNIFSALRIISFTITGSSGQQVFSSNPNSKCATFNISNLIPGIYFTRTETPAGFVYSKIVVAGK